MYLVLRGRTGTFSALTRIDPSRWLINRQASTHLPPNSPALAHSNDRSQATPNTRPPPTTSDKNTHIVASFERLSSTAIMATELTVQSERAFQKQPHVFQNNKKQGGKTKRAGKGGRRWVKDVGLGFRTPKTAIEGNYIGE